MRRKGLLLCLTIFALLPLWLSLVLWSGTAQAQEKSATGPTVTVVLVDIPSVGATQRSADLFRTFLGLASTFQEDRPFVFMDLRQPGKAIGPVTPKDREFTQAQQELEAMIASAALRRKVDLYDPFAETYNLLSSEKASPDSIIYLLVGNQTLADFQDLEVRLVPLMDRLREAGWAIHGLLLPDVTDAAAQWVRGLAQATEGEVLELTVPEGLKAVGDDILHRSGTLGALTQVGQARLEPGKVMNLPVSLPPGTGEATLVFFRESPSGSLRLNNPDGLESSAGDRASSQVLETPYAIIWRLVDPVPGKWSVVVSGVDGTVSAWQRVSNKYSVVLQTEGPLPLAEPNVLMAYITDGEAKVSLEGVRVFARITSPDGASQVYEMNDRGEGGDALAGDGYYSVQLPPLEEEGEYSVTLELTWPGFDYTVASQYRLGTQPFPALEVTSLQVKDLEPGQRTKVATVFVHVAGEPYAILPERLSADLASPDNSATVEVTPQRTFGDGRAWQYDVYVTVREPGLHQLVLRMELDYSGRSYIHSTDPIVLWPVAPPPEPAAVPTPVVRPRSVAPAPEPEPAGFPWWVLAFPGALVVAALGLLVYSATRTRPYGYLYNDRNELVVDFSRLRRHPLVELLFRDTVSGDELKVPGLEGVTFKFLGRTVRLITRRPTSVRVNNQPVVDQTTLPDRAWIGAQGRVYSYLLSPPQTTQPQGASDD